MVNRMLHNICEEYSKTEYIISSLKNHKNTEHLQEYYQKKIKHIIQDLYHESKRLGGDEPRPINNYWDNEPARVLIHRILVKARELDFADVSYEDYVDKDGLIEILNQMEQCCKYKEVLKK